jgi:hypothetical protein
MDIGKTVLASLLLFAVGAFCVPFGANAAQIEVSNCQSSKVRICAFDNKNDTVGGNTGAHELDENKQGHFTCDANCYFKIVDCSQHPNCDDCKKDGHWLDHSWGKGTYNLVGLVLNSKEDYESSNFVKTESTEICQ